MTNQPKHTATPWQIEGCWIGNGFKIAEVQRIGTEEGKANAEFIVRAVNSHDVLVEALKEVRIYLENLDTVDSYIIDKINKTLKQAETI